MKILFLSFHAATIKFPIHRPRNSIYCRKPEILETPNKYFYWNLSPGAGKSLVPDMETWKMFCPSAGRPTDILTLIPGSIDKMNREDKPTTRDFSIQILQLSILKSSRLVSRYRNLDVVDSSDSTIGTFVENLYQTFSLLCYIYMTQKLSTTLANFEHHLYEHICIDLLKSYRFVEFQTLPLLFPLQECNDVIYTQQTVHHFKSSDWSNRLLSIIKNPHTFPTHTIFSEPTRFGWNCSVWISLLFPFTIAWKPEKADL